MSRSSLHDGATPIIVPDDEDNIIPENDNMEEDVFHSLTIKEEKELVWVWTAPSVRTYLYFQCEFKQFKTLTFLIW